MAIRWVLLGILGVCACSTPEAVSIPPKFSLSQEDDLDFTDATVIKPEKYSQLKNKFDLKSDLRETIGLGGLKPALNLLQVDEPDCLIKGTDKQSAMVVESDEPTSEPVCRTYLAEIDDEVVHLKTKAEVQAQFAPIESREEALSYYFALEPHFIRSFLWFLTPRVAIDGDGFLVAIFKGSQISEKCFLIYEKLTRVSRDGEVTRISNRQFRSSKQLDDCKAQPQSLTIY